MPITLNCPRCHKPFRVRDESIGGRVRCPSCGSVLQVPPSIAPASHFGIDPPGAGMNPGDVTGAHRPMAEDVPAPASPSMNDLLLGGPGRRAPEPADHGLAGTALPSPPSIKSRANIPLAPIPGQTQSQGRPVVNTSTLEPVRPLSVHPRPAPVPQPHGYAPRDDRAWRKVKGGLGMIRWGLWLFLVPILAAVGHAAWLAFDFDGAMKDRPGLIPQLDWPFWKLMVVAYTAGPLVPAILLIFFGRLRCAAAPPEAHARGLALWAATFTVLGLFGAGVAAVVHFMGVPEKWGVPATVLPYILPIALCVSVPFVLLADLFTLLFIGQIGWPVNRPQLQRNVAGFLSMVLIVPAAFVVAQLFYPYVGPLRESIAASGSPFGGGEDEGTTKVLVVAGVGVAVVILFFLRYAAVAGAGRRAVKTFLARA